ncbi:MAG: FAD-binding oxidoreductase [Oscillatoriales cyanobacterium]|nr:MAG: FAD-binding oxidoreductase [Oscillatoriales cyanobacterium]
MSLPQNAVEWRWVDQVVADRIYIVGAGVAGLLTAWAIVQEYQRSGRNLPDVVMIDRAAQPGAGLTAGNGRSLTATEGLVAGGLTPEQLATAFTTPADRGGYTYPGYQPTITDRHAIEGFLAAAEAAAPTAANREQAMVQFGLQNLARWRKFAGDRPDLAARCGLHLGPKLRIYQGSTATARARQEVARLNQVGDPTTARLVDAVTAVQLNPGLADFLSKAGSPSIITLQPGGAIHAGRLVAELARELTELGCLRWHLASSITSIDRDSRGRIHQLRAVQGGMTIALGNSTDHFIFATGFDPLLERSGAIAQPLFPIAGTSITFTLDQTAIARGLRFPRRAWKHDGLAGPLVISPTFCPQPAFLAWLNDLAAQGCDRLEASRDRDGFISPHWATRQGSIAPAELDPRQLDQFQPDALGPAAGTWEVRIGGCKFYPGTMHPLDLHHPGSQWALRSQLRAAQQFFPDLVAHSLGEDWRWPEGPVNPQTIAAIQPWVGSRPVYPDGEAIVGPCAPNGFAITGTGSWGLASGLGNSAIAAQWLMSQVIGSRS